MSTLTSLISAGGGGGTQVNQIAQWFVGDQILYEDPTGGVWLKTGNYIVADSVTYPDAFSQNELTAATRTTTLDVSLQESSPFGITFNNDGTYMYITGNLGDEVNQYTLSTPFDLSTATFLQNFSVSNQETIPNALTFNNDGTYMYVIGSSGDDVNQYTLSTPFNISTATFTSVFSVGAQFASPQDVKFKPDGTQMFVGSGFSFATYNLSTPFDVTTASLSTFTSPFDVNVNSFQFNSNGTKFYLLTSTSPSRLIQYRTSTPFSTVNLTLEKTIQVVYDSLGNLVDGSVQGFYLTNEKLWVVGNNTDSVYEYNIPEIMGLAANTGEYDFLKLK